MNAINIEYVDKLHPIFTKPKRVKILVGGRASTKSTGAADMVATRVMQGELWCCAREHQNSIEESVHRTLLDEIARLNLPGFRDTKTSIEHVSGGRIFYRGLARNVTSLKSTLSGVDGLWIEEGEDITANTLRVLTASVRLNATDTQRAIAGEDVKMPEILVTMNRKNEDDAVALKWLKRAEPQLEKTGYYEDDLLMVVELNYTDMPDAWFKMSGLEQERLDDEANLTTAQYEHKWLGKYYGSVDNPLIRPEWFDACIDAHKILGWKPTGAIVASHDPSDVGPDDKAFAARHGSLVYCVESKDDGDINEGGHWATDLAIAHNADHYRWDCDGMGVGLNEQTGKAFKGKGIVLEQFKGSQSPDFPDRPYMPADGVQGKQKTNKDSFTNQRAQYHFAVRDKVLRTYKAVVNHEYHDPDDLISFSSDIEELSLLRSELCRIPIKPNSNGKLSLYTKEEMRNKFGIRSPNRADSVMMLMKEPPIVTQVEYVAPVGVYTPMAN